MFSALNPPLALAAASASGGSHFSSPAPQDTEAGSEDEGESGRKRPPVGIIVLVLALVLIVGGYAAGVYAFSTYYYPGTTVFGVDISLMDADEASQAIESITDGYSLTITGNSFSWSYTPADASELIDTESIAARILASNDAYFWPLRLLEYATGARTGDGVISSATSGDLPAGFDSTGFIASLDEAMTAYNAECTGAFDAVSAYDTETGTFTVEMARSNEMLDTEAVEAAALTALAQLATTLELDDSCFEGLADGATDEELQAACDAANEFLGVDVTFMMEEYEAVTLDGSTVAQWIVFDEELNPSLDTEAVTAWANEIAALLNTVDTERTYTREDGKEITVSGGTWGWEIDVDSFVESVETAVAEKQTGEIALTVLSSADVFTTLGGRDWGAYIDVDLTEQHAYYYDADGNLLWDSGIISANTTLGRSTPTGVYYINTMYRNITLRGPLQDDGSYEWESKVSYWMAFKGTSYGLHDASWQKDEYFEDATAYLSHGSHGCVNLPVDAAAELYEMVYVGLCVVVHW